MKSRHAFMVVTMAYVLAHGLTAFLITPLQSRLFPDITAFASLVYLPHGVRVLATWLLKRVAVFPLCIGAFVSEFMFTPSDVSIATDVVILVSIAVGAASALLAFELMRVLGYNLYSSTKIRVCWKRLLLAGAIASVINSIGQTIVFTESIPPGHFMAVISTYAVGDLVGLIVSTLVLMFVFRWMRAASGDI